MRRLPVVLVFLALLVGFVHAVATDPANRCTTVDVPEGDEHYASAQRLMSVGWYGKAGDGAERLYSPACR